MENGEARKRAKWPDVDDVEVKQEAVPRRTVQRARPVAVEPEPGQWTARPPVQFRKDVFHCSGCERPLKPPVRRCDGGHHVCVECHGQLCTACDPPTAFSTCPSMDAVIQGLLTECIFTPVGCRRNLKYHEFEDHIDQCAFRTSYCPELVAAPEPVAAAPELVRCGFWDTAPALVEHLASAHSWAVTEFTYGVPCRLAVPPPWLAKHVLVEKDERRVFALTLSASGAYTTASVVCVRESAAGLPRFNLQASADVEGAAGFHLFLQPNTVASSNRVDGGRRGPIGLTVPTPSADERENLHLTLRIDMIT